MFGLAVHKINIISWLFPAKNVSVQKFALRERSKMISLLRRGQAGPSPEIWEANCWSFLEIHEMKFHEFPHNLTLLPHNLNLAQGLSFCFQTSWNYVSVCEFGLFHIRNLHSEWNTWHFIYTETTSSPSEEDNGQRLQRS